MPHELRNKLPDAALHLLDCSEGKYSEWATASALAMYAMNAGLDEDEFVRLVTDSDFAYEFATEDGGRDRSNRLEGRLRRVWESADRGWQPPIGDSRVVRVRLEELSQRISEYPWSGRTSASDRAVSLALVGKAHEAGVWTVDASERDLSVRAGVARTTAGKALKRLTSLELVTKSDKRREGLVAQRWVLNLEWGINCISGPYEPLPPVEKSYGLVMRLNHPAFLRAALGQTAERVWIDLMEHPATKAGAVADRLGVSVATVRRTLDKKLVANGLAVRELEESTGKGRPSWVYSFDPAGTDRLDSIAVEYGVTDWEARTVERYEAERDGFEKVRQLLQAPEPEPRPERVEGDPFEDYVSAFPEVNTPSVPAIPDPFEALG
ncbi:hypothetical protein [Nocardia sp. NPDC058705]|uniref:hypothetical protein n=1 Tax=Nocardia sp. NPDC058705 TaxID=3346609 RepID=UPI0036C33D6B